MLLTLLGCVPVLGIAANAYNAYLYFEEGDILNGILSVAGVGVGGLMSTIGMAAKACTLIQAGQYVKAAGLAYSTAAMAYMTAENACNTFNLLLENNFVLTDEVLMSAGETIMSGIGTVAGFKAFNACMNETAAMIQKAEASCFVAGTQVLTREGFKNIEDIQSGDYVYSTNDETGESDYKEVLEVFVKETEVITHVFYEVEENGQTRTEEIETTLNHRFWSEGEWKSAGTLKEGDLLTLVDGMQVEVTEVTYEDRHETVYNMEVADYHTYYVGEDGVWVHNRYGRQSGSDRRGRESGKKTRTYYHVTTEENAKKIIESGELRNGNWESDVFAWTQQPTKRQASIAGISSDANTVIRFETNASFMHDAGNKGKSISSIVVQTVPGQRLPISISNVEIVGFKKEWWQFWKNLN